MNVELAELNDLVKRSDFITVHLPKNKDTVNLFDTKMLATAKPSLRIINVARGGIINEADLAEAVKNGVIAGAALDVFEDEPNVPAELRACENVVLTPHMASGTWETRQAMADLAFGNLQAHFAGKPLLTPVP